VVVDNTPGHGASSGPVPVVGAAEVATPGYARNRGAERGSADWLVFLDADVTPSPDLLECYFDPAPGERTALLAGGVLDQAVTRGGPATARYAYLHRTMDQESMGFPKTANVAVRRSAFEAVGGFREDIRAAEDADLTYRIQAEGWEAEPRGRAVGVHSSRQTLPAFLRQKLVWGAGSAWLDRAYPGAAPGRRLPGLAWWAIRAGAGDLARAARARDRDAALLAIFEPLELLAYELGRFLSNERRR
jgi:glycosyltransferase involved in cell wall biosynthesis